ncbi:AIM24 family protein [Streptococcus merionis]|uniref:HTH DNA-binding protein n=1 Tax=Streptococcus merionis TaxID=400065 RepID=A0A239SLG0_9STRE|nr:AIM24 family protein [Streptococcus merionis]SNU86270.1 HTH DNA-binding protein [Streptococcus merionis]
MTYTIKNFLDNDDIRVIDEKGPFQVIEYTRNLSISPNEAMSAYFQAQMHVRRRQLVCTIGHHSVTTQRGAMQWTVGSVNATTGIKGAGDLLKKTFRGVATGESAIKPEYKGNGQLILEPTYKHILLLDLDDWGNNILVEDGLYLASDSEVKHQAVAKKTLSSMTMGNEGLFNLGLKGSGVVALESSVPFEELIQIELNNDELRIDGSMAIAWSASLHFTVERSGKSLIGSAASGDGLVNVYRGTGTVLLAPMTQDYSPLV